MKVKDLVNGNRYRHEHRTLVYKGPWRKEFTRVTLYTFMDTDNGAGIHLAGKEIRYLKEDTEVFLRPGDRRAGVRKWDKS